MRLEREVVHTPKKWFQGEEVVNMKSRRKESILFDIKGLLVTLVNIILATQQTWKPYFKELRYKGKVKK